MRTGLYGRTVITFGPKLSTNQLPSVSITSGDVVGVTANNDSLVILSGIVVKVEVSSIDVAFDDDIKPIDEDIDVFNLIKLSNDVTHRRLKSALNSLKKNGFSHHLVQTLFGETEFTLNSSEEKIQCFNQYLNESQKSAIEWALSQKELAIIHGPPGTGKTTVLIEFILQCVRNYDLKVLATAPSNVAVDNILEKLSTVSDVSAIRIGHPARSLPQLHKYSLDAAIVRSDDYQIVCDLRSEIELMVKQRKSSFNEIKSLRKELKEREKRVLKRVLQNSKVVLSTLTGGSPDHILRQLLDSDGYYPFDVVVIDECSQALEASSWIVLNCARKCVLAGDHMQLPPTIISEKAAKEGLEISLMERLIKDFGDKDVVRMLDIQYRMNEQIMKWSSKQFYYNKLKSDSSVKTHSLNDIINGSNISPLVLIDSTGCHMNELDLEDEESKGNEFEADIVSIYVKRLIKNGFNESSIGVITPYNLQVQLLRARLKQFEKLEIRSVDGFQGREKEIIILSLVRSNDRREVGFLSERRRINVAVTRAKRHLAVVCDSETVSNDSTIKTLIDHLQENGDIVCAQEFEPEIQNLDEVNRPSNLRFKAKDTKNKSQIKNKTKEIKSKQIAVKTNEKESTDSSVLIKEKEFEERLKNFLESENERNVLEFPTNLSSFERLLVHKIAETLDLIHESVGEGEERHIVVKKKSKQRSQQKSSDLNQNKDSIEKDMSSKCDTNLPQIKNKTKQNSTQNKEKPKLKPKNVENPQNLNKRLEMADTEDIDSLIALVKKSDNTCSHSKCKTNITVLGQKCEFCGLRFCLTHSMPEIHSPEICGQKIKDLLRSQARKEGKLHSGSGKPEKKKLDSFKRNYLEKKLTNKLNDLSNDRKTKKSDKK